MKKKRFFSGTGTFAERKWFAVFHACTVPISMIIGALLIFLFDIVNPLRGAGLQMGLPMLLENPFANVGKWLGFSLFVWNFLGSWRISGDYMDAGDHFLARAMVLVYLFIFPFVYFHNLWYLLIKRNKGKDR